MGDRSAVRLVLSHLLMADLDTRRRITAANAKAASLGDGFRIADEPEQPNLHTVRAYLLSGDEPAGRVLCRTRSDGVDALEEGLDVLRGIIELGQPWPDER
jgi:hypothetical protein